MNTSNSFSFTALLNGTTINGHAGVINGPLVQRYNKTTGTYVPNFATMADNVKPYIYPHLNRSDNGAIMIPSSVTFAYNGTVLSFDVDGNCTNSNLFKKVTKTVRIGGTDYNMPALMIINNMYSVSNTDNDMITISGTVEIGGQSISFSSIKAPVTIGVTEGNQYDLYITASGDTYLTDTNKSVILEATAMLNGAIITDLSGYQLKWYRLTDNALLDSDSLLEVGVADVASRLDVRCDLIVSDTVVASAFGTVHDATDPYVLAFDITGITGDQIAEGQTAVVTPHVRKRSTGEIVKDTGGNEVYADFTFNTTNNAGAAFKLSAHPATSFTGSSASISYADVISSGGCINGYVTC